MARYFIEVAYLGTSFNGFQIQENQLTIQGEINSALSLILKEEIQTTTSSRTDAGVHAYQNYLHFDTEKILSNKTIYSMNAIVHGDLVIKNIYAVGTDNHSRFDATGRKYSYHVIQEKNPFLKETAYFFPFAIDVELMNEAAKLLIGKYDFTSFSKRNTDVNNYFCTIELAYWEVHKNYLTFHVQSNRFLRGMVRAIVATLLQVGRKKISIQDFQSIIDSKDCTKADFSADGCGLFLEEVKYNIPLKSVEHLK
jgi:tRNA pseudouridine38-40 synthase